MPEIEYVEDRMESEELLERLCPPVRNWFKDKFPDFTEPQKVAIPRILNGEHLLLCSPTGSGKTLTAFLTIIDDLVKEIIGRISPRCRTVRLHFPDQGASQRHREEPIGTSRGNKGRGISQAGLRTSKLASELVTPSK